ncbi:MAG TPA: hypothetical protein VML53_00430 [Thermoplasmata archaeon]|nr:hypothetical protein [Thermoplasmata archaeon]
MTARSSGSSSDVPDRRRERRRPLVVLDTNALFLPFRTGLDLVAEVERLVPGAELVVPSSVLGELGRLDARATSLAGVALGWARTFRAVPTRARGDAAVVELAVREQAIVLTADRALGTQLRRLGTTVLSPRDRTRLERRPGRAAPSTGPSAPAGAATVMKRPRLERDRARDARRRPPARPARPRVRQRRRRRL